MIRGMKTDDFRTIGNSARGAIRRRAVALVREEGRTQVEAAQILGVSPQTMCNWMARFDASGKSGLEDRRRNEHRRNAGVLTAAEARKVQRWIIAKCPEQLSLPFALWTAQAVRELIANKLGKDLGLSTMQLYLKKWGFTSQKPLTRATQRDPERIAAWLKRDYRAIAARAKREKAAIYWGDESGICNQDQIGKGYAPQGQTPVLMQTAKKLSLSMIAAVSNRGLMRFRLYEGALNAKLFIDFLKRLTKDAKQKVFFIVDNLRVHKALEVRAWVAANRDKIELFYLPPYAPEHNPEEYLNNDLKQQIKTKPRANSKAQLAATTASILRSIQKRPARVKSYFRAQHARYAA